jgi:hypothetical protein
MPSNETEYEQQHDCAYERVNNQGNDSYTEMDVKPRQQPVTDKGAQQTDYQIPNQTKARALHHLACQPAGNEPNHDDNQEAFIREMHGLFLKTERCRSV